MCGKAQLLAAIWPQLGTQQGRGASRKGLGGTLECHGEAPRDVGAEVVGEGVGGVGDGVVGDGVGVRQCRWWLQVGGMKLLVGGM